MISAAKPVGRNDRRSVSEKLDVKRARINQMLDLVARCSLIGGPKVRQFLHPDGKPNVLALMEHFANLGILNVEAELAIIEG